MGGVMTKRRGRPSLVEGEQTESVPVRLPKSLHDRACQVAIRHGVSVSQVMRVALSRMVTTTATNTTS